MSSLDEVRVRAEAATVGPFRVVGGVTPTHPDQEFYAAQSEAGDVPAFASRKADAEFIAHAREDVLRLVAVTEAAGVGREQANKERDEAREALRLQAWDLDGELCWCPEDWFEIEHDTGAYKHSEQCLKARSALGGPEGPTYEQLEEDCEATALQREARNASLRRIRAAAESDADLAKLPALRDFLLRETADAPTLPDVIEGHVPAGVPGGGQQEQDLGGTAGAVPGSETPKGES